MPELVIPLDAIFIGLVSLTITEKLMVYGRISGGNDQSARMLES
jgi:hypothetical protein